MATYTKKLLSGSTNGRPIQVAATATAGTLIHTAVSGTSDLDEIWLWCINTDSSDVELTIEYGGVTDPDDLIIVTIPLRNGLVLVIPGLLLQNSLVVRAFAGTADVLLITGFVNGIT